MNHKVQNVEELFFSAQHLYNNVVSGVPSGADGMLRDLAQAVDVLKENWKGADAGVKIQEIVSVHNELVEVRNALALLARDSSSVASNYRRIQLENGAPFGELQAINVTEKNDLPAYVDNADTIDINRSFAESIFCFESSFKSFQANITLYPSIIYTCSFTFGLAFTLLYSK